METEKKCLLNFFIICLFSLFIPSNAFAMDNNSDRPKDLKFEYAFEIGGEPSFVSIQDRQGFLWFTSFFNGMVRYDGSEVKHFRTGFYLQ
ncbi:MAG: hypothetical protein V7731_09820 [Amphritea sp.]